MAARAEKSEVGAPALNVVTLVGRVSMDPEQRELPSGDVLWSLRLVVRRDPPAAGSRQSVDTIDCAVWTPRLQRSVSTWRSGDVVEVQGALRRRFYRTPVGASSRVEVEMARGRLIRRSAT